MWQTFPRRRRVRWIAIGSILIGLVWCFILYKSVSFNYEQEPLHSHPPLSTTITTFLYDVDNLDLFLKSTPVKYNYHIFYYPW
jgi:hypothetical protein